jgi:hypothetical protein
VQTTRPSLVQYSPAGDSYLIQRIRQEGKRLTY